MILKNLRTLEGKKIDIEINGDRIVKIAENIEGEGTDLGGRIVSPALVDSHAHIDSNFLLDLCKEASTPKFEEALKVLMECKENLTENEIYSLMKKSVIYYIKAGSLYVRTHVMIDGKKWRERLNSIMKVKEEFKDKIFIQVIGFIQSYDYFNDEIEERIWKAIDFGIDGIGGQPHLQPSVEDGIRMIKKIFDIATQKGILMDFHADYSDDPSSRFSEIIVSEALRRRYFNKVSLSHLLAMHSYHSDYALRLMKWLKEAGISVIVSPITELEGSGAFEDYPKRRGIPRVREMIYNGVNVALGHDDIQNQLNPIGDGDLLKASFALMIGDYMYFSQFFEDLFKLMTYNGAKALNINGYGLKEGMKANIVVFEGNNLKDILVEIKPRRMVISNGKIVYENYSSESIAI
ncbi:MAG: amidohydrolase family protein [Acidianus hospitalis]